MSQPANEASKIRSTATILRRCAQYSTVIAALALGLAAAPCQAETAITAQAIADNGAFLPYAPPPPQPAGLCLVDTGVNLNPDTESTVVDRTAIDGGSGEDVSPTLHGTVLAMMAAAPINNWGMVGTAPRSIEIISVRILEPGQTTFPFSSYAAGITECLQLQQRYDIRVINLSLGDPEIPSGKDYEALGNAVEKATDRGVAVVAAAGNDDGGPVEYPAAYPGVLSVGASDTQGGTFCSFSNRGEGLRMIAPGCDLNGADPISGEPDYNYWQGTSEASDIDAAALDALESYQPSLSPQAAEEDLTDADNGVLDIAQTFRNAGLGQIVTAGEAAEPSTQPPPSSNPATPPQSVPPSAPMDLLAPFPRPSARFERVKGRLELVLEHRPSEAQAQVRYLGYHGHSRHLSVLQTRSGTFNTLTLPSLNVREITVRYTDPYDLERASPWITLRLPQKTMRAGKSGHRP
jgi:hypothetical protein